MQIDYREVERHFLNVTAQKVGQFFGEAVTDFELENGPNEIESELDFAVDELFGVGLHESEEHGLHIRKVDFLGELWG